MEEKRAPPELTYANLPILGAGGKVFSVRTEAHAPDVQIAIFVCFVINKDAVRQVWFNNSQAPGVYRNAPCLCPGLCIKNLGSAIAAGSEILSISRKLNTAHHAVATRRQRQRD
jgi:hypothetical protein